MVISPPPQITTVLCDLCHYRICDRVLVLNRIFVFVMEELLYKEYGQSAYIYCPSGCDIIFIVVCYVVAIVTSAC